MKNFRLNRHYLEISLYVLGVTALALILVKIIWNIAGFGQSVHNVIQLVQSVLSPFTYGFFIAYFMNTTVRYLEQVFFRRIQFFHKRAALKRLLSVALTYIFYFGCLIWIISYLAPEVYLNTSNLVAKLPTDAQFYLDAFYTYLGGDSKLVRFLEALNIDLPTSYDLRAFLQPVISTLSSLSNVMNIVLSSTVNIAYALLNFILGLVIAFYMLCDKEKYRDLIGKILLMFFKKRNADKISKIASESNRIIEKFIIGKAIDSLIIALMFFMISLFLKPPYALLLTLLVGISNMIPYFGPIAGAAAVTLITLVTQPPLALWVLLVVFVLQQFDGMYLGPKILGDSTGLPPMLVILAIIVGGALFNVPGMFFGVPIFAIIRNLVSSIFNRKYDQKISGGPIREQG
ncbi:MAG: AI-2E family transporter [Clostridiales bacterium]|jgi:predicted PurR-regulated permease PerM|nr:AI-2E family transporter [Clostridiales bacterium]